MRYRTGRERKLVYSGTISGSILMTWKVGIPPPPFPPGSLPDQRGFGFSLQAFAFPMPVPEVAFQAFSPVAPGFVGLPLPPYEVGWEIMASDGLRGFEADGIIASVSPSESGTWSWEQNLSGTWSISLDVEEWFEPYFWTGDIDPDGFPLHGGAPQKDGLRASGVRYFERMREGGKITATLTVNGVSVHAESVLAEDDLFDVSSYDLSGAVLASAAHGQSATSLVTVEFQSLPLSAPVSHVEDWGKISLETGFLAKAHAPEETDVSSALALGVLCPPDSYELHASLRAFDSPYPDAGEVAWTPKQEFDPDLPGWSPAVSVLECSPEAKASTVQRRYRLGGFLNGAEYPWLGAEEKCSIRAWLHSRWLHESGEDERDWRCSLLGRRYGLGELRHEPETTLEPERWTLEGGTWVSETPVEVLSGSEGAELVAWFDPRVDSESYRYIHIQVFGVEEPCTITVLLGEKEYRLRLNGGEERKLIDLMDPHEPSDTSDPQHTRWPLGSAGEPAPDGPLWGVSRIESLRFVVPAGCRFGILGLSLVRQSEPRFMALAPFLGWQDYHSGQEAIRLGHALVDGRQCLEAPYILRSPYSPVPISSFLSFANESNGWSVQGSPPAPDEFHTDERPALWLLGAGALHDGEQFLYTSDVHADGLTLEAQALWDEITTYPLCGNPFDDSEYPVGLSGAATPVAVCKHLRGCAEGVALRAPLPIRLLEAAAEAERGEAVAGALGVYRTGLPFGFGAVSHQLLYGEIAYLWEAEQWHNRGHHRFSFRVDQPLRAPAYAVGPDLRHALGWCTDGELNLALSVNSAPSLAGAAKVELAAEEVGLAYSVGKWVRLLCVVSFEGEVRLCSIGEPELEVEFLMSFGMGSSPCIEISAEGLIWVFFVRSGQVYGALLDARFQQVRAPAPVVGVPEADAVASRQFVGAGGQWKIGLLVAGPSGISWFWSLDGINFSP